MGAVPQAGNRYQVVIGGAVQTVYNDIMALPEMTGRTCAAAGGGGDDDIDSIKAREREKGVRGKVAWIDSFFEFLSDSFRPILGALLGASFFITFMALMATLDVIPDWNAPGVTLDPSWAFINLMWQSVFVFLPLMVAYNASKKIGADPWVGFAIMAVLMLPGFTALGDGVEPTALFGFEAAQVAIVPVFGFPLPISNYSSQVFPPLLMAAVLGPLYKLLRKIITPNLQLIFVPFFAMLIMIPLTAFIIGPIGVYAGAALATGARGDQQLLAVHLRDRHPARLPVHGAARPALAHQRRHAPEHPDARLRLHPGPHGRVELRVLRRDGGRARARAAPPRHCRCGRPPRVPSRRVCSAASRSRRCTESICGSSGSIRACSSDASSAVSSSASAVSSWACRTASRRRRSCSPRC